MTNRPHEGCSPGSGLERIQMEPFKYISITDWTRAQKTTRTATDLAETGIPVFPCNDQKRPMTAHGFKDASTTPSRVALFFRDPGALIAMPTGLASNIDVIDEDPKNGGNLDTLGSIPMTAVARTRSGGRHVFFKHRDGIRNTTNIRPGIDVRGEGGYVVLWAHSSDPKNGGSVGEWISGDLTQPLPEYPENLTRKGTELRDTGIDLEAVRNGVKHGNRNDLIFRGLCKYRHLNRTLDEAKEWAAEAAANSIPPYTEQNTDEMAERVYAEYEHGDFPEPEPKTRKLAGQGFHHTDMGNADRFDHLYGDRYLYVHTWNTFMVYDGKRWVRDERGQMGMLAEQTVRTIYRECADTDDTAERGLLVKHAKSSEAQQRIRAFLELLKNRKTATPEDFDRNPMLFNVANGTLDLETGKLRDHDRDDLITNLADVAYDPHAQAPVFDKFLSEILPVEAIRGFVQRLTGYALNGRTSEKALPIYHGPGDAGKSTLLNALAGMFGEYGMQASSDLLVGSNNAHPTGVADLYGKRYVTNIETDEGKRLRESVVKQLTGGDRISARRMRENFWNFWPSHTFFMATNHKPEIRGTDSAIWNRVKIVPFTVSIPKPQQDRTLPEKLRDELPGILAWAVRGHMEWLHSGLQEPEEVKAATDSYRADMDVLARFIDEECETGAGIKVKTSRLYGRYKLWCEESGEQAMRSQDFSQSLQDRGYSRGRSDGTRVYKGIGLGENKPSTITSGAHEADENHYRPEYSPHGEEPKSSAPSDPVRGVIFRCPDCEVRTLHIDGTCTECGKGDA